MATAIPQREDPNELISCPYNKAHQIIRSRMQTHLTKCKKNHLEKGFKQCPFNSIHLVPGPEFTHHVETCKDRDKLDSFVYQKDTCDLKKFPIPSVDVTGEESWDEVVAPTYDPTAVCMTKPVLRNVNLLPAAKRRDFREEERNRHHKLGRGKAEVSKASKENAEDYAKRTPQSTKIPVEVIDQNDPYGVASLTDRIKKVTMNVQDTNVTPPPQHAEGTNREGEWCKVQPRGRGRGVLKPST